MKIVIGLGNPGLRHRNTRHNAGFMAVKVLANDHRLRIGKKGYGGEYAVGRIQGEEVLLFRPLTYMNLSGGAVEAVCSSRLDDSHDLLVISDDFNLSLGDIRLREKGSAGGHNGLESIIERIGPNFARLRIGVGSNTPAEGNMSAYVLSVFPRRERAVLKEALCKAVSCIEIWLAEGVKTAMSRCNG